MEQYAQTSGMGAPAVVNRDNGGLSLLEEQYPGHNLLEVKIYVGER